MAAYTKEQFEEYKAEAEYLEVEYIGEDYRLSIAHKDYEDYIYWFNMYSENEEGFK